MSKIKEQIQRMKKDILDPLLSDDPTEMGSIGPKFIECMDTLRALGMIATIVDNERSHFDVNIEDLERLILKKAKQSFNAYKENNTDRYIDKFKEEYDGQ